MNKLCVKNFKNIIKKILSVYYNSNYLVELKF